MSSSRHAARKVARLPVLAVVVGALVAGGLADGAAGSPASRGAAPVADAVPVAAPPAALSSSWFCAGATDGGAVSIAGQVVIANDGPAQADGAVTVVPSEGRPVHVPVSVPARSSVSVPETVPGGSQWVGAVVDMEAGAIGVDQVVDGPLGKAVTPCATSGSSHWYFPTGASRLNADEAILLLNPYQIDAIVDMSFTTDQGVEAPQDFLGIDVPAGGLVAVDVGARLRRRASIAATVTARSGSVVAWQTQWVVPPPAGAPLVGTPAAAAPLADPALPVTGVTVTLGAPSPGQSWVWPDGLAGPGVDERYVIYNPGSRTADLRLSIGLAQGTAEPFDVTVAPYQVVPVISEQQARIPAGVPHAATLISLNGVPVVAARQITDGPPGTAGAPASPAGVGVMVGARAAAAHWLVPDPGGDGQHQGVIVVENPGTAPVTATVSGVGAGGGAPSVLTVTGGGRSAYQLPAGTASQPVQVDASGPVYVEHDVYGVGGTTGISLSSAVPLSG